MRFGRHTGLRRPRVASAQGGGASIANQTINFGALTLSSAGGAKAISTLGSEVDFVSVDSVVSGTGTGWGVSGGRLIRSSDTPATSDGAVLACTTALGQVEITIEAVANEYSVASRAELLAVKALGAGTYTGKTIRLRNSGDYVGDGTTIDWTSQAPASVVTITSDTNRAALTPGFDIGSSSKIKLDAITAYRAWVSASTGCVIRANGSTDCTVNNCDVSSNSLATVTMEADPEVLSGIGTDSSTAVTNLTVTNNYIHDVRRAVRIAGTGCTYQGNTIENCVDNFGIFFNDFSGLTVKGNTGLGVWANGADPGNPHSSLLSFQPGDTNSSVVLVEGNRFLVGTNRFDALGDIEGFATGLKLNVTGVGIIDQFTMINNVLGLNGNIAIEFANATNSSVEWNTLVCPEDAYFGSQGVPGIYYYDLGVGCRIANNAIGVMDDGGGNDASLEVENNETILRAAYASKYTGASFSGVTPANSLTKFTPLPGSTLLTASPKIGAVGTGYYDWETLTGSWPSGDVTPPVLTSPSGTTTGPTTAALSVSTDTAEGTLYAVVTTSATSPTKAQVKAGQDHTGAAGAFADGDTITATGAHGFSATGLSSGTTYYAHFMHEDVAGNQSNVSSSASFAPLSAGFVARYNDNTNKVTGSTYTISVNMGTDHADRVVMIGVESSVALTSATLGGVAMTAGPTNLALTMWYLATGGTALDGQTTVDFVVTNNSGSTATRCEIAVWVCYPASKTPVDSDAAAASSTNDVVLTDLSVTAGGFVAAIGQCLAGGMAFSWNGVDAVVEDFDLAAESTTCVGGAHILVTETSAVRDLTLAEVTSGTKRMAALSFGPP